MDRMNPMRTTVDIPDSLYRRLKLAAALRGCSIKDLMLRFEGGTSGAQRQTQEEVGETSDYCFQKAWIA
jgi:hypothetical protein